ncbi:MAG: hypothetical protein M1826_004086 [Phylliscum demangeonii]|nr:MAG: hypothetical protein M1826_004086 [Phylliscum demangeonii]
MYEYLRGPGSRWKPYFDAHPHTFNTVVSGPRMSLQNFKPALHAHVALFPAPSTPSTSDAPRALSEAECIALCQRMRTIVLAYSFNLMKDDEDDNDSTSTASSEDEDEGSLVTVSDHGTFDAEWRCPQQRLNADRDGQARLFSRTITLTMRSISSIPQGAEIFNDYGPLPHSVPAGNRRRMAIDVRLGEKRILQTVLDKIQAKMAKWRDRGEDGGAEAHEESGAELDGLQTTWVK